MRNADMNHPGSTALVTGASSGIGAATAKLLVQQGFRVVVTSRGGRELDEIATATGAQAHPVDLTRDGAPEQLRDAATATIGTPDLLICNAGVGWQGSLLEMPAETIAELVRLNLIATMQVVRSFADGMVERGSGHIAFVSSIAGSMGVPNEAVYSASKAAVQVFGRSAQLELAPSGIGVTTVNPGVVDTAFFERRGTPYQRRRPHPIPPERVAAALLAGVRRGKPEVFVPAWLRVPARLQGAAPGLISALRSRI